MDLNKINAKSIVSIRPVFFAGSLKFVQHRNVSFSLAATCIYYQPSVFGSVG